MIALIRALAFPLVIFGSFFSWIRSGFGKAKPRRSRSVSGRGRTRAELDVIRRETVLEPPSQTAEFSREETLDLGPDVVWAGKELRIPLVNPGGKPRWYRLTATDMEAEHYEIRAPEFGTVGPYTLNRLEPGQKTEFELILKEEGEPDPGAPKVFHVYVTRFDRDSLDAHHGVVRHTRCQWVPKPKPEDISLEVQPPKAIMRPWREHVALNVLLTNRSYFPMSTTMTFGREDEKGKPIPEDEPTVLEPPEPVQPHSREHWKCVVPPATNPTEPFWVRPTGAARVAGGKEEFEEYEELPANQQIEVLWIRLFGMFRDWAVLILLLLGLLWLFWGAPVWWVRPAVQLTLNFDGTEKAGLLPPDVKPKDLNVSLQAWDTRRHLARKPPVKGKPVTTAEGEERATYNLVWPKHRMIFGFRWLWFGRIGWNGRSRREMPYLLKVTSKAGPLDAYDLSAVADGTLDLAKRPVFRRWWVTRVTQKVPYKTGAVVDVEFVLTSLTQKDKEIRVVPIVEGQEGDARSAHIRGGKAANLQLELSGRIPEGKECDVVIMGTAMPSGETAEIELPNLTYRIAPWPAKLDFSGVQETGKLSLPAASTGPVPYRFEVYDAEDGTLLKQGGSFGEARVVEIPVSKAEQPVTVKILVADEGYLPVPSNNVTLKHGTTVDFPPWEARRDPDRPKPSPAGPGVGATPPTPMPLPPLLPPQVGPAVPGDEEPLPQPVRPPP